MNTATMRHRQHGEGATVMGILTPEGDTLVAIGAVVQGLLESSGTSTFGELLDVLESGDDLALQFAARHRLTGRQVEIIDRNLRLLRRLPTRAEANLRRCPLCGAYDIVAGEVPVACRLTTGCQGITEAPPRAWRIPWDEVPSVERWSVPVEFPES
ncbi:hypothetical protein F8O01_10770 [Pseudoclavibacter chungangensis]|uniref:Uncharacterized protein n=1 Tax=Pseudoclavibacter chungangensis TaxID=587635 RepID=A0A7J5BQS1_9MICO|nr:hypothetical protein [Pseudoclavibacter chungangensis]KAB1656341.1 hypothetical protein F8O01_10770 [Pseudoclavibacter chungangensis]NYJ67110.1 hypothetical protein [Pseudoclavibacter chungangensis]